MIVGATAGVGRALSELLAARGHSLVLLATDEADLRAQAAHLRCVYEVNVEWLLIDAAKMTESVAEVGEYLNKHEDIDNLFLPIGYSTRDDLGSLGSEHVLRIVNANLSFVIALCGKIISRWTGRGYGQIAGFGSISGLRGRDTNIVYAAAKRGLASYFESLQQLTYGSGVRVQFFILGYVASQQTFGKKLWLPVVAPQAVARFVAAKLESSSATFYFPRMWALVALILPFVPRLLFRRYVR
jgi:short-subunit dehydrogenase